jgi:hypothetical protein
MTVQTVVTQTFECFINVEISNKIGSFVTVVIQTFYCFINVEVSNKIGNFVTIVIGTVLIFSSTFKRETELALFGNPAIIATK